MKFAVFALVAGFCIVAVTSNATGNFMVSSDEVEEFEYTAQDLADGDYMDIQLTGMYFVFKKALRTLKGLNCTIKEVLGIRNAAQNFLNNVAACGGEVSKKVQQLINACTDIIKTCEEILGINESVCGNTIEEEDDEANVETYGSVSGAKNAHKCFVKMLRKLQTLRKQIKKAVKLIKQIKDVPADTGDCVMNAVTTLESTFTQFPANIKECSKLTSN